MHGVLLQDWMTLSAPTADSVAQSEVHWFDADGARDAVYWLEVKNAGPVVYVSYETAPSKAEALFSQLAQVTCTGPQTTVTKILDAQNPTVGLSRWLRWRVIVPFPGAWGITFRLHAALNFAGRKE